MDSFFVITVKKRLDSLSCPLVKDVNETWISDLLFCGNNDRLDLLEWLLLRFDSDLGKMLDCADDFHDTFDKRVTRILNVASSLSLCSPNDSSLIMGTSVESSQLSFISTLIDLACSSQEYGMKNEWDRLRKDCTILDKVVAQSPMSSIYNSTMNILPPDISKILNMSASHKPLTQSQPEIDKLKFEIKKLDEMITQFKDEPQLLPDLTQWDSNSLISIESLFSNIDKLLTSFADWCDVIKTSSNNLSKLQCDVGPYFDSVSSMSHDFHMLLSSLVSVRNIYEDLKNTIVTVPKNDCVQVMDILPTLESFQKVLQQLTALGRLKIPK